MTAVAKPVSLSDALATVSPARPLFENVPAVTAQKGRVEGFESLRDLLLLNWRQLAAEFDIPLQSLLKLVLETDRHALFAALAEEKLGDADRTKQKQWAWFQNFLTKEVDVPFSPEDQLRELPGGSAPDGSEED